MYRYRVWWTPDRQLAFVANEPIAVADVRRRHGLSPRQQLVGDSRYLPCSPRSYARMTKPTTPVAEEGDEHGIVVSLESRIRRGA